MAKDHTVYLRHIVDAIEKIEIYTKGVDRAKFMKTSLVQDGVIRQIQVIGEATKLLSADIRARHPGIPWKDIAGMRDKVVHDYLGVDLGAVWDTVQEDLPALKRLVAGIISK